MATAFGPGIRALSVYNVNDGTTIQIDGADISPESTIEESKTTRTSAKGNVSKLMTVWELNVQFADASGFSSLNSADSQTREWQVVAAGVNGKNLQWYEDSTFIVENSIETDPAADSNYPYTLRMRHISESPAIYNNVNLTTYGAGITNSFDASTQVSALRFATFRPDGTKMYAGGNDTDSIFEYDLSTAWDVSTATYSGNSFDVSSQDSELLFATFRPDGTKMYAGGNDTDSIFEYDLSTAWDVSTATYSGNSFDVSSQETVLQFATLKSDGTKMYAGGSATNFIFEYDLSTAWDVSTATYSGNSFDANSQETFLRFATFRPDGTKMYAGGSDTDSIFEYDLSTAWDVSTATYSGNSFDVSSQETVLQFATLKSDGTKMYAGGSATNFIFEYDLSTAWDVSSVYYQDYQLTYPISDIQLTYSGEYSGTERYVLAVANFADVTLQASIQTATGTNEETSLSITNSDVYFAEISTSDDGAVVNNVTLTTNGLAQSGSEIDY